MWRGQDGGAIDGAAATPCQNAWPAGLGDTHLHEADWGTRKAVEYGVSAAGFDGPSPCDPKSAGKSQDAGMRTATLPESSRSCGASKEVKGAKGVIEDSSRRDGTAALRRESSERRRQASPKKPPEMNRDGLAAFRDAVWDGSWAKKQQVGSSPLKAPKLNRDVLVAACDAAGDARKRAEDIAARYVERRDAKRRERELGKQLASEERQRLRAVAQAAALPPGTWPRAVLDCAGNATGLNGVDMVQAGASASSYNVVFQPQPLALRAAPPKSWPGLELGRGPLCPRDLQRHNTTATMDCAGTGRADDVDAARGTVHVRRPFADISDDIDCFATQFAHAAAEAAGVPSRRIRVISVRPA
jgi:hypothetical protein